MLLLLDRFTSPIGTVQLVYDDQFLRALDFHDHEERLHRLLRTHYGRYDLVPAAGVGPFRRKLEAYFAGDFAAIGDIPVRTAGTVFQNQVWSALRQIPTGQTISYGAAGHHDRPAGRSAGRRSRQRSQSDRHRRTVPSGDRRRRQSHGLWWRPAAQAVAAGP